MDVIDWILKFTQQAINNNDRERLQLVYLYQQGDALRVSNPEGSYQVYQIGRQQAEQLDEPCWIMFFAQRMSSVCIYELENLDRAMELVARDYVLSTQDSYKLCPINPAVRLNLVETYLYYDPVGYADKIREVIDYLMETESSQSLIQVQLYDFLAQLHLKLDLLDEALDYSLRTLDDGLGYLTLTRIYWERGEYDRALEISLQREMVSSERIAPFQYADAQAWTAAMIMRTGGDQAEADNRMRRVDYYVNKITFVPNSTLYDALAEYQEASDRYEMALAVRDTQLEKQQAIAGPEEMMIVRLRRARLLGRMGKVEEMQSQIDEMRSLLHKFAKPEFYQQKFQLLQKSYYSDVVWKGSD